MKSSNPPGEQDARGHRKGRRIMNSRLGIFFSTLLIIAGVILFSATILAEEVTVNDSTVRHEMRASADAAHREAAREAVERLKADSKPDLDIAFVARTSVPVAGD